MAKTIYSAGVMAVVEETGHEIGLEVCLHKSSLSSNSTEFILPELNLNSSEKKLIHDERMIS